MEKKDIGKTARYEEAKNVAKSARVAYSNEEPVGQYITRIFSLVPPADAYELLINNGIYFENLKEPRVSD